MAKSWTEKRDTNKEIQVKINDKKFADIPAGTRMLIPSPKIVDCGSWLAFPFPGNAWDGESIWSFCSNPKCDFQECMKWGIYLKQLQ